MKNSFSKLLIFFIISVAICGEDFYKLLGVTRASTDAEIKKAFKKLSLKYHPDKNKDKPDVAKAMFIKIANAYEVLSDPERKQIYDTRGEEAVKEHEERKNQGHGGGFGGSFEDMFSQFFGGGRGNFNQQQEEVERDYFDKSDVMNLNMDNISRLYRRQEIWFILFYRSSDSGFKELIDMWKELAEKVYGIFKIAAINCKADEEICEEFDINRTPMIIYFPESSDKEEVYKGLKKWEDIFKFAAQRMQSFVRIINKDNYGDFIFSEPTQHKIILFTQRKTTAPLFKALSKHFKGKLSFGEIRHLETELVEKFGIKQFPTVFVLTDPENYMGVAYDGPLKRDFLEKFLNQYAYNPKKVEKSISVKELTNEIYNRQKICNDNDNKNICLIYITHEDSLSGAENQMLEDIAKKYVNDPLVIYFINPDKYRYFWVSFDHEDNDSKLVILKGKRRKYIPLKGDITTEEIVGKLDNVVSGGGDFKKLITKINLTNVHEDL